MGKLMIFNEIESFILYLKNLRYFLREEVLVGDRYLGIISM